MTLAKRVPTPWREDNLPEGPMLFRIIEPNFPAMLHYEPDTDSEVIAYLAEDADGNRPIVGYLDRYVLNTKHVRFYWFFVITPLGVGWVNSYNCTRKLFPDYESGSLY